MFYIGGGDIIHTTAQQGVVVAKAPGIIFRKDRYTYI
jgi:hypothetical protein